jgi:hypothetical protein
VYWQLCAIHSSKNTDTGDAVCHISARAKQLKWLWYAWSCEEILGKLNFYLACELSQYLLALADCHSECKVLLWDLYTIRNTLVWLFLNTTVFEINDYCCVVRDLCYFKVSVCTLVFEQFIVLHYPVIYQLSCTTVCFFTRILVLVAVCFGVY